MAFTLAIRSGFTKLAQTISASDVTATYGDTGKSVSATTNGNGAISYQVKTGNDVVTVNAATGALTILKAGTATITVIAKETDDFAAATAEITVTVSKAAINPTVTIADWNYGEEASAPSVEGNTGNGAVTFSYKVRNAADDTFTTTVPTDGGEYTVRAQIALFA